MFQHTIRDSRAITSAPRRGPLRMRLMRTLATIDA